MHAYTKSQVVTQMDRLADGFSDLYSRLCCFSNSHDNCNNFIDDNCE